MSEVREERRRWMAEARRGGDAYVLAANEKLARGDLSPVSDLELARAKRELRAWDETPKPVIHTTTDRRGDP